MAVRQGFEGAHFTPTPVDQLLTPIKLQAETKALYGNILSSIRDMGDYISSAEDYFRGEYKNRVGNTVSDLTERMINNKNVESKDINDLINARREHIQFFSPGGLGYRGIQDKKNYLATQKRILDNKDISLETKNDWLRLANIQYAQRFKEGYDFSDINPTKEIDLPKYALEIADKIEPMVRSIERAATPQEKAQLAIAYGIPEDSSTFKVLTETKRRTPEQIRQVLTGFMMSNPEIQSMFKQNDLLRQVNPSRLPSEIMQNIAIESAVRAAQINDYKQMDSFSFLPEYVLKRNRIGDPEIGLADTYISNKNSGKLENFWGKQKPFEKYKSDIVGNIEKEIFEKLKIHDKGPADYFATSTGSGYDKYKEENKITGEKAVKKIKLSPNEFNSVLDDLQKEYQFNDDIKDILRERISNGTRIEDIPEFTNFLQHQYDLAGNTKVTSIIFDGKSNETEEFIGRLLQDNSPRKLTIVTPNNKVKEEEDNPRNILSDSSVSIDNLRYEPVTGEFAIVYSAKDNAGRYGSYTMYLKPTKEEMRSITNGKIIPLKNDEFGFKIEDNGNTTKYIRGNYFDQNGNPSYIIGELDNNGNIIGERILDSSDPDYTNMSKDASYTIGNVLLNKFNEYL